MKEFFDNSLDREHEEINPLKISYEQYNGCMLVLAREAIENNSTEACQKYFELKKRATFGDKYPEIEGMEDIERQMLAISTEKHNIDNGRKR